LNKSAGRNERPLWVKIGLWGLHTRVAAWVFVWLSLALAMASVTYAAMTGDRRFLVGGILVVAALWYYGSIRWVDRHGSWS
jgi:hypothetical protein